MTQAQRRPQRRPAFTLIELLVVMALIVTIFALGIGYVVFGRDNEKTVLGAQAVSGALLNAKGRARRDGRPTGVRVLFPNGATQAGQLQFIQQPEDYNSGQCNGGANVTSLTFNNVDFVGGGDPNNPLTWTVQPGDYFFVSGAPTPHQITSVSAPASPSPQSLTLASPVTLAAGVAYNIVRAPRPIPSEDLITLPAGFVIDQNGSAGLPPAADGYDRDLVFAPSGGVVGKGTQSNKVFIWICSSATPYPSTADSPLIVAVEVRTGAVGSYPVLPGNPYFYANDPRASGI